MKHPLVSIIIVHYHVKKELFACLESLKKMKTKTSFEVIVVDNDERKTIKNSLKKKYPFVRYIESPENNGFGAGNNRGANTAKGKYLFFLNPDTEVFSNTLDKLVEFIEGHKSVGIVAP